MRLHRTPRPVAPVVPVIAAPTGDTFHTMPHVTITDPWHDDREANRLAVREARYVAHVTAYRAQGQ